MTNKIISFFDKLEDKIRKRLSRFPIAYAFIGAIGTVLVWKGMWEMADSIPILFGPVSFILGVGILLITGLLVSFFVGDSIILSGIKGEKKMIERAADEVRSEKDILEDLSDKINHLERDVHALHERQ